MENTLKQEINSSENIQIVSAVEHKIWNCAHLVHFLSLEVPMPQEQVKLMQREQIQFHEPMTVING